MYICYIDESGTSNIPGNTSHFVLAGVSIPVQYWKSCDNDIEYVKKKYRLIDKEIHVAWILRTYPEQNKIANFEKLSYDDRTFQIRAFRTAELLRLQRSNSKQYLQTKKNYRLTEDYAHLTLNERKNLIIDIAKKLSTWGFARLFAECIDKIQFNSVHTTKSVDEQSFEQVISRFEQYLQVSGSKCPGDNFGLLIHDNNPTVAKKHTLLMKKFHKDGTRWVHLKNIIETPLFVDSELTSMVQMADLCAYALRRYLENKEEVLFDLVFSRAERKGSVAVGVRHFTNKSCTCKICNEHRRS